MKGGDLIIAPAGSVLTTPEGGYYNVEIDSVVVPLEELLQE